MTCWKFLKGTFQPVSPLFVQILYQISVPLTKYTTPSSNTSIKKSCQTAKNPRSFWNLGIIFGHFFQGRKLLKPWGDFGVSPGTALKSHLSFRWQAPCPRHRRQLGCWSWWAHALQALGGRASAPGGGGTKGGHGTCFGILAAELLRLFRWYGVV